MQSLPYLPLFLATLLPSPVGACCRIPEQAGSDESRPHRSLQGSYCIVLYLFAFFRFFPVQAHSCLCSAMSRVPRIYRRCATVWDPEIRPLPSAQGFSSPQPHVCFCVREARVCSRFRRYGVWEHLFQLGRFSFLKILPDFFSRLLRVSCVLFCACAGAFASKVKDRNKGSAHPLEVGSAELPLAVTILH